MSFVFILTLGSTDPFFNLSAEEYLLREKSEDFFLLWRNEPCIVIGKNQVAADEINPDYVSARSLPVVRRMTGGGAVYHDAGNLNFSFIQNGEPNRAKLCRPVIEVLRSLGVEAELSGRNDITVGGRKVSGTAMCSHGGRSLFHGTLLINSDLDALSEALRADREKLAGHGVKSVRSRVANISEFTEKPLCAENVGAMLARYMTERGGEKYELNENEISAVSAIRNSKYTSDSPNCGAEYPEQSERVRLGCGTVCIKKKTTCGRIDDIRIFGDFMNTGDVSEIENHLKGIELRRGAITSALESVQTEKYIPGLTAGELADIITKSE